MRKIRIRPKIGKTNNGQSVTLKSPVAFYDQTWFTSKLSRGKLLTMQIGLENDFIL